MFTLQDACRYSLVPHRLGLCGPKKSCADIFVNYSLKGKGNKKEIKKILKNFKAVYFYCKQIAKANKISDPLSEEVLEAYWIGNDLLEKAKYENNGYPHHSYHVWQAKPFNPKIKLNDKLKRICQISIRKIGKNYYSFHWKEKIQKLDKIQMKNLRYYNRINKNLIKKK
ncbi:MAG: DUF6390 family protein [Patescibacteria group bacterium]|nr:DUF6390 family protein [Patescibacteria group bacterium]